MHKDMTLKPWSRRTMYFSDAQTHPLLSASACRAPLRLGSQQQSCFGTQYVWEGRGVGMRWGGVGASVGSGSKLLEDVRRAEPGSCLAVSAFRRSLAVYTDPANTPTAGANAVPGEGSAHPGTHLMLELLSLYKVGALCSSELLKKWVNKSAAPRWRCWGFFCL